MSAMSYHWKNTSMVVHKYILKEISIEANLHMYKRVKIIFILSHCKSLYGANTHNQKTDSKFW